MYKCNHFTGILVELDSQIIIINRTVIRSMCFRGITRIIKAKGLAAKSNFGTGCHTY